MHCIGMLLSRALIPVIFVYIHVLIDNQMWYLIVLSGHNKPLWYRLSFIYCDQIWIGCNTCSQLIYLQCRYLHLYSLVNKVFLYSIFLRMQRQNKHSIVLRLYFAMYTVYLISLKLFHFFLYCTITILTIPGQQFCNIVSPAFNPVIKSFFLNK